MKRIILFIFCSILVMGCANNKILVRTLDSLIIESATKAQAGGAKKLTIETSIASGLSANASVPISVVSVGASATLNRSTPLTIVIDDLQAWKPSHLWRAELALFNVVILNIRAELWSFYP